MISGDIDVDGNICVNVLSGVIGCCYICFEDCID